MAEGATVANAFVQIMPSMDGATGNITKAIMPELSSAGEKGGSVFGGKFSGSLASLVKPAAAAFAGAFAIGQIKESFVQVEEGYYNVVKATGATGDAAKALKSVYEDVSTSVVGDFGDIGSAVGEVNTRLGLNGSELEKASEQMIKYARVTGQDATKATKDVVSMMRNVGIPANEMGMALDKLTVAGQAAGIDVSSLANNVTKYNAVMKEMGFTTDEQIALMAQFEVSGADTASVLNAMKKGVAGWAREGKDAGQEFRNFVSGVQDGTVTAGDAVEIFGTKGGLSMYEAAKKGQLAFDEMYDTIVNHSDGALDQVYKDTLSASEKFDLVGKSLSVGFYEVLEPVMDAITPHIDEIVAGAKDAVSFATNTIVPVVALLADNIDTVGPALGVAAAGFTALKGSMALANVVMGASPVMMVVTALSALAGGLVVAYNTNEDFRAAVDGAWSAVRDTVGGVIEFFGSGLEDLGGWLVGAAEGVGKWSSDVVGFWSDVADGASEFFSDAKDAIGANLAAAKAAAAKSASALVSDIGGAWKRGVSDAKASFTALKGGIEDKMSAAKAAVVKAAGIVGDVLGFPGVAASVRRVFEGIKDAIKDPIGTARDFVSRGIEAIKGLFDFQVQWPHIPLPHFSVSGSANPLDWLTMGVPSIGIDWYAVGGFTDGPTVLGTDDDRLQIAGEKGTEFVWPSYEPYFSRYADAIASRVGGVGGVDIHDCTFVVRKDSDIEDVADALYRKIRREQEGLSYA